MAQIQISIINDTSSDWNVHVFDLFGPGRQEVQASPFALAVNEQSPPISINASSDGSGMIEWSAEGGLSETNVDVVDGKAVAMR